MKTFKFNFVAMIIAATIMLIGTQANAQKNQMRMQQNCMDIPDLTDEQKTKIEDLNFNHQKEMLEKRNLIREKRARLATLQTADNPNMKDVNNLIDEIGNLKIEKDKSKANHRQEVRKLLTDKQRLYFDTQKCNKNKNGYGKNNKRMNRGDGMYRNNQNNRNNQN